MYILIQEFIFISCYTEYMFGTHLKIDRLISIYKSKKIYVLVSSLKSPIKNYDIYVMMSFSKIMGI